MLQEESAIKRTRKFEAKRITPKPGFHTPNLEQPAVDAIGQEG